QQGSPCPPTGRLTCLLAVDAVVVGRVQQASASVWVHQSRRSAKGRRKCSDTPRSRTFFNMLSWGMSSWFPWTRSCGIATRGSTATHHGAMPATFAWLAVAAEQRRRMRGAGDQFREETTMDDLGVGAIRDAFSDTLFPGTSTLQTRLRYVLFIPWLMLEASKRPTAGEMAERYHDLERDFIGALERGTNDDEPGIIGRRAGKTLQRVPSVVYSGMLAQWGILERGLNSREFSTRVEAGRRLDAEAPPTEDGGIAGERIPDGLDPALPAPPDHLLRSADFPLLPGEVDYLREAITRTNP